MLNLNYISRSSLSALAGLPSDFLRNSPGQRARQMFMDSMAAGRSAINELKGAIGVNGTKDPMGLAGGSLLMKLLSKTILSWSPDEYGRRIQQQHDHFNRYSLH